MSTAPKPRFSPEEYLEIERKAEFRSEYVDGEMFALSGASFAHTVITGNVVTGLRSRLRGKGCTVHPVDLRVRATPTGLFCYPDVVVVCGEPRFVDGEKDTLTNPVLLVEVLSPSTADWDRGGKFVRYRRLASLREVLFVAQDAVHVEQFTRQDQGLWLLAEHEESGSVLKLNSLGIELPVAEVYEDVPLTAG